MKRMTSLAVSVILGTGLLVGGASPAYADAYDCRTWYPTVNKASGTCTNGTGEFRVYTRCEASLNLDYWRYGPWVRVGQTSTASCSTYWETGPTVRGSKYVSAEPHEDCRGFVQL